MSRHDKQWPLLCHCCFPQLTNEFHGDRIDPLSIIEKQHDRNSRCCRVAVVHKLSQRLNSSIRPLDPFNLFFSGNGLQTFFRRFYSFASFRPNSLQFFHQSVARLDLANDRNQIKAQSH